jgi:hypothetical protein
MTKLRPPLSIEQAVLLVAASIGFDEVERIIGRRESTVRSYGDPDRPEQISLRDAIALDRAFAAAGGDGHPFHHVFCHELELPAAATAPNKGAIARLAAIAAKESGEANAALLNAVGPGGTATDIEIARRELEESVAAQRNTLAALGAGPGGSVQSGGED